MNSSEDKIADAAYTTARATVDAGHKIVSAIERNTAEIRSQGNWIWAAMMMLAVVLAASNGCPRAKAAPLVSDGDEIASLQYWYTVSVPQDHGVYDVQAPALPALFLPQIVELGEPPRLMETPEPGTGAPIGIGLFCLAGYLYYTRKAEKEAERKRQVKDARRAPLPAGGRSSGSGAREVPANRREALRAVWDELDAR